MKFTINNLSEEYPVIEVVAKNAAEALKKAKEIAGIPKKAKPSKSKKKTDKKSANSKD